MTSVTNKILAHLEAGNSITSLECLSTFGCLRLAARIYDLREAGYNIDMQRVTVASGKSVGRYTLLPPAKIKTVLI